MVRKLCPINTSYRGPFVGTKCSTHFGKGLIVIHRTGLGVSVIKAKSVAQFKRNKSGPVVNDALADIGLERS